MLVQFYFDFIHSFSIQVSFKFNFYAYTKKNIFLPVSMTQVANVIWRKIFTKLIQWLFVCFSHADWINPIFIISISKCFFFEKNQMYFLQIGFTISQYNGENSNWFSNHFLVSFQASTEKKLGEYPTKLEECQKFWRVLYFLYSHSLLWTFRSIVFFGFFGFSDECVT